MSSALTGLVAMLALSGQLDSTPVSPTQGHLINIASLVAIDEVPVAAEEAGRLKEIHVEEGDTVADDQILAQIDDKDAVMAKRVAAYQYQAAKKEAENEITIEAAVKSHAVAEAELETAQEANRREVGTFTETEVRRLRLAYQRAGLQINLAQFEKDVAKAKANASLAQYEQADAMIERRKLLSPLNGIVNRVYKNEGDWVQPGDAVVHVIRMEKLRVRGNVSSRDYHWSEMLGKPVEVTVQLKQGRTEKVRATIGFASPVVEDDRTFRVWADIDNRQQNGYWLFGPGMECTVDLEQ